MVPSPSNRGKSETPDPQMSSSSQGSEIPGLETEQMFRLIDSFLPFEACLYYQFLPLALEGKYLKLGMVVPQDSAALDYVRHILAYLNCSLKTEVIPAELHQAMLSAYLNYSRTSSSPHRKQAATKKYPVDRSEQPTLILSDPQAADLELSESSEQLPAPPSPQPSEITNQSPPAPPPTPPFETNLELAQRLQRTQEAALMAVTPLPKTSPSAEALLPLEVKALHLSRPIEYIATLPPQQLLQELLGRVLVSGIGRLYFERQPDRGRILWSQDGVLQSVLDGLALPVFQGVIIELKRVVNLPLLPVIQPKQVEIERRYQQESLLLRLRFMPGTHGEEATLQVLRGVALKFYQRQKIEKLGQDALKLAQQLQRKLNEMCDRADRYPMPLEVLPALNQLLRSLNNQLEALDEMQSDRHSDNSPD